HSEAVGYRRSALRNSRLSCCSTGEKGPTEIFLDPWEERGNGRSDNGRPGCRTSRARYTRKNCFYRKIRREKARGKYVREGRRAGEEQCRAPRTARSQGRVQAAPPDRHPPLPDRGRRGGPV